MQNNNNRSRYPGQFTPEENVIRNRINSREQYLRELDNASARNRQEQTDLKSRKRAIENEINIYRNML